MPTRRRALLLQAVGRPHAKGRRTRARRRCVGTAAEGHTSRTPRCHGSMNVMDEEDLDYSEVPDLTVEMALAWHRFRLTAGWPKPVETADLTAFAEESERLGGLSQQQLVALLDGHSGFDLQDWDRIVEALGHSLDPE